MSLKTHLFNRHLVMDETEASMYFAARVPLNNELILSCSIFFLQRCEARHSFMLKWHLWADSWTIWLMLCSGAEFMVRGTDALHKPSSVWPAHMQTVCFSTIFNGKASEAFCKDVKNGLLWPEHQKYTIEIQSSCWCINEHVISL